MWIRILIGGGAGILLGNLLGNLLGYFGKCSSGTCPLTANPYRGAMFGLVFGILIAASTGCKPSSQPSDAAGATAVPHVTTVAQFDEQVLKSDRPVLVDFYASWCGPCRTLAPTIVALKAEFEGRASVIKVNIDEAAELARRYKIQSIPAVMLFDKGKIVTSWIGLRDAGVYRAALNAAVAKREVSAK